MLEIFPRLSGTGFSFILWRSEVTSCWALLFRKAKMARPSLQVTHLTFLTLLISLSMIGAGCYRPQAQASRINNYADGSVRVLRSEEIFVLLLSLIGLDTYIACT